MVGSAAVRKDKERGAKGKKKKKTETKATKSTYSDHDESSGHTSEETLDSELLGERSESRDHALSGLALGLVHSGKESIGRLRDESSGETSDDTTTEGEGGLLSRGELGRLLARRRADVLERDLKDGKLGHGVRNLLEQDGTETGVESSDTLLPEDSGESTSESVGKGRLGDESDSDGLKGAEGNVGEELGNGGGSEVDGLSVLSSSLDTVVVDGLLLPELVYGRRWADQRSKSDGRIRHRRQRESRISDTCFKTQDSRGKPANRQQET